MTKQSLQPASVFDCFAQVNLVPRPSKKEAKMIDFLVHFGKELNLETKVDEAGNVLIRKPATPGMENRKTVILQSHMEMVCEKNADIEFNFMEDAIQTVIEGEWLKAKGTTLGADDGIGVAMQMAILKADDIEHGPIECVFTVDEETGLTGAFEMKPDFMQGDYLINLDSEDEGQIFVSCAGGAGTTATFTFEPIEIPANFFFFQVTIKGLTGGHSGDDINKNRANANKLLARFLYNSMQTYDLYLCDIQAGGLHNAIPREATAICAIPMADKERIRIDLNILAADIEEEYKSTEPQMKFILESTTATKTAVESGVTKRFITALQAVHNGVYAMCQDIDLVETSSNLASARLQEGNKIVVITSQRSSLMSARKNMSATIRATFDLAGATTETSGGYPGWAMNPKSDILRIASETYQQLFGKSPKVLGIHAGLECGLFSEKYPGLDMISFGPTLRGVHSPDERLHIPSVEKVWDHLLLILKNIPTQA